MPDSRITALTALTSLSDNDIFPVVDDPSGTPITKKITALNIKNYVQSLLGSTGTSTSSSANLTTSTAGVTVTASATPHTKGAYTEMIASTSHTAETLIVTVHVGVAVTATNTSTLLDIAVGGAGSEVDLIPNLNIGFGRSGIQFVIPITIGAGSRVSARIQSVVASQAITLSVRIRQAGDHSVAPTACTAIGVATASSNGTSLTVPGSTHTKGAWLELVASTADAYSRLLVLVSSIPSTTITACTGLLDIGVGAAASEVVVVPDVFYEMTSAEVCWTAGNAVAFTVSIAASSRIAARYQSSSTAAGAVPRVSLYALRP